MVKYNYLYIGRAPSLQLQNWLTILTNFLHVSKLTITYNHLLEPITTITNKQYYQDNNEAGTSKSSHNTTKVDPHQERIKGTNDTNFKGKEKLVLE